MISSFQNDAVDNAISAPLPGDIPAYRKTAKRSMESSKEQYQRSLEKWYKGLCGTITGMIEDNSASEFVEKKRALDDDFLSYKNTGEPLDKAMELINHYLDYVEISYPESLVADAKSIIIAAEAASSGDDYEDPIVGKIRAQRTTTEAFKDDGARNARKLAAYISVNDDLEIDEDLHKAKAMRLYLGMSQREAAEKLGIYLSVYQKYENIPGYVMHASFSRVCRIMELLHLNLNKFFMKQYELNEIGYEVASRRTTAPPKKEQIRRLQECCSVSYVRGVDKDTGEKLLSSSLR